MPMFNSFIAIETQIWITGSKDPIDFCATDLICSCCENFHSTPIFLGVEDFVSCPICDSSIWTRCGCYPLKHLSDWQVTLKR
jgi:hypothetical protein